MPYGKVLRAYRLEKRLYNYKYSINMENPQDLKELLQLALLLQQLIAVKSFSGSEEESAKILMRHFRKKGFKPELIGNNVVVRSTGYDPQRPTLLLVSHHDTVKPSSGYTRDPYAPIYETDNEKRTRLYGLGSNDAGASVVCMADAFCHFCELLDEGVAPGFNLLFVAAAEEEISGANGISSVLPSFPEISCAIVGEPTQMEAAVGERGLLVLDGYAHGVAGHAARKTGVNALYKAMDDIAILRSFSFDKESSIMGKVSIQVTQIEAGTQHNVVPDSCHYVVDIRTTDAYGNQEICDILQSKIQGVLVPRNLANRASVTPSDHPLVKTVAQLRIPPYISPATSDWMRLSVPAIKMGPGVPARSHGADEYICLDELGIGSRGYRAFISSLSLS